LLSGEAVVYQTRKALWLTNFYDFVKVAFETAKVPNGKNRNTLINSGQAAITFRKWRWSRRSLEKSLGTL
jgi:hypothetical protein